MPGPGPSEIRRVARAAVERNRGGGAAAPESKKTATPDVVPPVTSGDRRPRRRSRLGVGLSSAAVGAVALAGPIVEVVASITEDTASKDPGITRVDTRAQSTSPLGKLDLDKGTLTIQRVAQETPTPPIAMESLVEVQPVEPGATPVTVAENELRDQEIPVTKDRTNVIAATITVLHGLPRTDAPFDAPTAKSTTRTSNDFLVKVSDGNDPELQRTQPGLIALADRIEENPNNPEVLKQLRTTLQIPEQEAAPTTSPAPDTTPERTTTPAAPTTTETITTTPTPTATPTTTEAPKTVTTTVTVPTTVTETQTTTVTAPPTTVTETVTIPAPEPAEVPDAATPPAQEPPAPAAPEPTAPAEDHFDQRVVGQDGKYVSDIAHNILEKDSLDHSRQAYFALTTVAATLTPGEKDIDHVHNGDVINFPDRNNRAELVNAANGIGDPALIEAVNQMLQAGGNVDKHFDFDAAKLKGQQVLKLLDIQGQVPTPPAGEPAPAAPDAGRQAEQLLNTPVEPTLTPEQRAAAIGIAEKHGWLETVPLRSSSIWKQQAEPNDSNATTNAESRLAVQFTMHHPNPEINKNGKFNEYTMQESQSFVQIKPMLEPLIAGIYKLSPENMLTLKDNLPEDAFTNLKSIWDLKYGGTDIPKRDQAAMDALLGWAVQYDISNLQALPPEVRQFITTLKGKPPEQVADLIMQSPATPDLFSTAVPPVAVLPGMPPAEQPTIPPSVIPGIPPIDGGPAPDGGIPQSPDAPPPAMPADPEPEPTPPPAASPAEPTPAPTPGPGAPEPGALPPADGTPGEQQPSSDSWLNDHFFSGNNEWKYGIGAGAVGLTALGIWGGLRMRRNREQRRAAEEQAFSHLPEVDVPQVPRSDEEFARERTRVQNNPLSPDEEQEPENQDAFSRQPLNTFYTKFPGELRKMYEAFGTSEDEIDRIINHHLERSAVLNIPHGADIVYEFKHVHDPLNNENLVHSKPIVVQPTGNI